MKRFLVFALVAFWATSAYGDFLNFDLGWSGASFGNNASATGTITLDDTIFLNPGRNDSGVNPSPFTSFSITVSGTAGGAGDGTWTLSDYDNIIWDSDTELDLSQELVGQATSNDPWGTSQPGDTGGDFNIFSSQAGAPTGTWYFELTVGTGEQMMLTNFTPSRVPEPTGLAALAILSVGLVTMRRRG